MSKWVEMNQGTRLHFLWYKLEGEKEIFCTFLHLLLGTSVVNTRIGGEEHSKDRVVPGLWSWTKDHSREGVSYPRSEKYWLLCHWDLRYISKYFLVRAVIFDFEWLSDSFFEINREIKAGVVIALFVVICRLIGRFNRLFWLVSSEITGPCSRPCQYF